MKSLSFTIQKLWPMLTSRTCNAIRSGIELSPLIVVWIALRIVNTYWYFEFQIYIFSYNRDSIKCQNFSMSKKGHTSEKKKMYFELSLP